MPQPYLNQMTQNGYQQIEDKIETLKKQRPERIRILQAARALGDLSENAEYSAAKRDLRHLESQLRFLDKQLQYAEIVAPKSTDKIELGKSVTIQFLDDNSEETFLIVGKQEAEMAEVTQNKLSFASPIGKALLNKSAGTTVTVQAPASSYQVKIIKVD
ncbi:transcription elongation factor GreA [Loigolactobacillus backii]|uniref:Transcription elongation factor GreA n=1 Tax=Loigolactobacillus backii TaxID=375175 RepID=A0A192H0N0_9LACO|nr:transcription elongation factor GreA [Loigolactobacillus backii]ANK61910.1 transcription elongation factor GreA [Loigolactobacillus backii]ANK68896.1 transcription elongation factor GreA [Loigolactobacillus backii]PIO82429.1 transcription elongation factor GreA [Loigolactobacillus backii]